MLGHTLLKSIFGDLSGIHIGALIWESTCTIYINSGGSIFTQILIKIQTAMWAWFLNSN